LWADGSGADVMKRIAAPMVGGLVTSAFLTLEIIPVIYTYWRNEQLLWRKLADISASRLGWLELNALVLKLAGVVGVGALIAQLYVAQPKQELMMMPTVAGAVATIAFIAYAIARRRAQRLISSLPLA
jgi:Cu(I)/Ag(I) efflux system membrane protein CusA/SilA